MTHHAFDFHPEDYDGTEREDEDCYCGECARCEGSGIDPEGQAGPT